MIRTTLLVIRRRESYGYQRDPNGPLSWTNNDANNSLDTIVLFQDGIETLRCQAQTVSNYPSGRFRDTVAPGAFGLKLWVEKRLFSGSVHGIVGARDLESDWIDHSSVQIGDLSRWLMHDTRKLKTAQTDPDLPLSDVTRVAWSAGCFVLPPDDAAAFSAALERSGYKPGDVIPGELVVV